MLSFRSVIVLHFTFRPVTHFDLTFVKGLGSVSRLIFYMWMSSSISTIS